MVATAPIETRSSLWSPVLAGLHADSLDCIQANLAAIADLSYGHGAHLALGAPLAFSTVDGPLHVPVVEASLDQRLEEAAELLGLQVARRWEGVDGAGLQDLARQHGPLYVVADAYHLSWVPYAGRQHLEHSFLLINAGPSCLVADAYHNTTQWGEAHPGVWRLPAAGLDATVPKATALVITTDGVPALDRSAVLSANAQGMANAVPLIDDYVDAVRGRAADLGVVAQLVLDIWLLGRSRRLHAAWLDDPAGVAARQAQAWLTLAAQSYMAMRRAQRSGGLSGAVIDQLASLLHEDVEVARRLAEDDTAEVRTVLVEELRSVMQADEATLAGRPLRELPNYNSFRLVEFIERIEARLGVEVDPDRLTAESLRDLDSLCGLFDQRQVTQP